MHVWRTAAFWLSFTPRAPAPDMGDQHTIMLWALARPFCKNRLGVNRTSLNPSAVYTKWVREQLLPIGISPGRDATSTAKEWQSDLVRFDNQAIGLLVCRPAFALQFSTCLSHGVLEVRDFWQQTAFYDTPLMFFRVVDAIMLDVPARVYTNVALKASVGLFDCLTPPSLARLMDVTVANGARTVRQQIASFAATYNGGPAVSGNCRWESDLRIMFAHACRSRCSSCTQAS